MKKDAVAPKAKRPRLLVADQELELPDDDFTAPGEDSDILTVERYIPSDPDAIRFAEIASNPAAHFLPTTTVNNVSMIYAGPEGLAPELMSLFTFPSNILRRSREDDEAEQAAKRPRIEGDDDVEIGRRDALRISEQPFGGPSGFDDQTFDFGGGDMELPGMEMDVPRFATPALPREPSLAPSRAESIAREVQYGDAGDYPLAMFGGASSRGESQAQSLQETPTKSVRGDERSSGLSKNTGMAMGLLRRELEAIEAEDEEKVLKFNEVSQDVSGILERGSGGYIADLSRF